MPPLKIAVISAGPSNAKALEALAKDRSGYDIIIGIQDIPAKVACDIWVILDHEVYASVDPVVSDGLPAPKIVTSRGVADLLASAPGFAGEDVEVYSDDFEGLPHLYWSGPRALFTALKLVEENTEGGKIIKDSVIDAYGFDMKPGPNSKRPSPPDRWIKENAAFKAIGNRVVAGGGKLNRKAE